MITIVESNCSVVWWGGVGSNKVTIARYATGKFFPLDILDLLCCVRYRGRGRGRLVFVTTGHNAPAATRGQTQDGSL